MLSATQEGVCVCVCSMCVHKASILGATTQHLTQPLITLYLALSMCVSVCVCASVRVKGPMHPLILNIDTLVSELHPLIPYPPLREERGEGNRHRRWKEGRNKARKGEKEDRK